MSVMIDIVSVVSQTCIFKKCCDVSFRPHIYNRLLRIGFLMIVCAAHLLTDTFDFHLSLIFSMAIDYAYISTCYRSDRKTKHIVFFFLYLSDFALETLVITGLLKINPSMTPAELLAHEFIAPVVTVGIRVTEYIGIFILKVTLDRKQSADTNWISVTTACVVSILILWFVFPFFWEIKDEKVNTALIVLVALLFMNNTFIISNYITISKSRMRELKIAAVVRVDREKIKRLLNAVKGNHSFQANLSYIRTAIVSGALDKAVTYIDTLSDDMHIYDRKKSITKNLDVDIILQQYLQQACKADIRLDIICFLPVRIPFETGDILMLISNIMDNAISAVGKVQAEHRYINLSIAYNCDRLSIVEQNPYIGKLKRIKNTYYSEKHGGPGFGIDIIRDIVDTYAGGCDTYSENQTYTISVVLQSPNL